jgi:hypothetical protein
MKAYQPGMRFLNGRWDEPRLRSRLPNEEITRRAGSLFEQACEQGMGQRTVIRYGLDNPFMQEHARATVMSRARKELIVWRRSRGR